MQHYIGLDVSIKTTSVCVKDAKGDAIREVELPTDSQYISAFLQGLGVEIEAIGLETGPVSRQLVEDFQNMGYNVKCLDARQASAFLKVKSSKNDRNDARTLAELIRMGTLTSIHHKSNDSVEIKTILKARNTLIEQRTEIKNTIRGLLKFNGVKLTIGSVKVDSFVEAVRDSIKELPDLIKMAFEGLLKNLQGLDLRISELDETVALLEKKHREVVSRLKTMDGVGVITALAFVGEIDDPKRFKDGRSVGAYIGCVPTLYESGETSVKGHITKKGPTYLRSLLHEAATVALTRTKKWSYLKKWAADLARKKGAKKAIVALERKMAIILWRMWTDKKAFHRSLKEAEQSQEEKKEAKKRVKVA
jgi:transposase